MGTFLNTALENKEPVLKIAIQKSGRLYDDSMRLLKDCGIDVKNGVNKLKAEAENFALHFRYPTKDERKTMTTVNRDMSKAEQERSAKRRNDFADIINSLESGESFIEDYPPDLVKKLLTLLEKKTKRRRK